MNSNKIVLLISLAALLALMGLQEVRFRRTLAALHGEIATRTAEADANLGASDGKPDELREAIRQLSQARAELAAAQNRLAVMTDPMRQVRPHMPMVANGPRFNPGFDSASATDPGFNPSIDRAPAGRAWGEEQATGPPDTFQAGDISTAWASKAQDRGEEWLHLDFSNLVELAEVRVRETHNPGAISRVAAVLPNGQEILIWEGVEIPGVAPIDRVFSVNTSVSANGVRVYLDTARIPGWNEIDAVEMVGRDGSRQWAAHARASSSYADP
ncbi:MAG: hypothetical protein QOF48_312 [Verrucomicrobiota bacterium]|jgi:hypothetical protein